MNLKILTASSCAVLGLLLQVSDAEAMLRSSGRRVHDATAGYQESAGSGSSTSVAQEVQEYRVHGTPQEIKRDTEAVRAITGAVQSKPAFATALGIADPSKITVDQFSTHMQSFVAGFDPAATPAQLATMTGAQTALFTALSASDQATALSAIGTLQTAAAALPTMTGERDAALGAVGALITAAGLDPASGVDAAAAAPVIDKLNQEHIAMLAAFGLTKPSQITGANLPQLLANLVTQRDTLKRDRDTFKAKIDAAVAASSASKATAASVVAALQ